MEGMFEGESSNPQAEANVGDQMFAKFAQRLVETLGTTSVDLEKKYGIERLKALGDTSFKGTTDQVEAEAWLNLSEKCFEVMRCLEDRKVRLATFLLQKGAEDWWRIIKSKRENVGITNWDEFKKVFQDKYYPKSFCDAKRNEFLKLVQG